MIVQANVGGRYFVRTTSGSRFIGKYLGTDKFGRYQFDLRPVAGTTTVSAEDVKVLEPTTKPVG